MQKELGICLVCGELTWAVKGDQHLMQPLSQYWFLSDNQNNSKIKFTIHGISDFADLFHLVF